jgi:hypothetical protein
MAKLTFFELLGVEDALGAATRWPRTAILAAIGELRGDDDPEDYVDLMQFLKESLTFVGVRSGGDSDQRGFWAELHVEPAPFPEERPLVAAALPDFAFVLEATGPLPATVFVTQSVSTGATEVVVQGLPVRIVFPLGFIEPFRTTDEAALPPPLPPKRLTVPFDPAIPDSLEVVLSDAEPSYIRVRVNVRLSAAGDVYVDTAVPVSIGPCYLSALPCRAVHDLQLIPSGHLRDVPAELPLEWTRHPFLPDLSDQPGVVTFRTIDIDPDHPTVTKINQKMHEGRAEADAVEFALEDVALGHFFLPIHGRFALRRALITPEALATEAFDLRNAPARIKAGPVAIHIYRLLLQTIPLDGTELPIAFDIAITEADAAAVPGAESLAISVDQKGVITGTHVFAAANRRHLLTVAGAEVSLAAVRFGFAFLQMGKSVKRPGLGIPDPGLLPKWADPAILVFDFVVKPGQSTKLVTAETPESKDKGKPVLLHDVGWSLGKISVGAISNLNVDFTIAKAFRLRIEELGYITDADGENYLMMSASIGTPAELANAQGSSLAPPAQSEKEKQAAGSGFGLRIQRLRFHISTGIGENSRTQIDGLSLWIRTKVFEILGFGMASERDEDPPGNHYEEMGFELKLRLKLQAVNFEIGVQFFHGTVTGADNFSYWMFGFLLGVLPVGSMELSQLRVLAVKNMTPRLDPPGDTPAEEMRLLRWFKRDGDALSLRLDRKLAARREHGRRRGREPDARGHESRARRALRLRVRLAEGRRPARRPRDLPGEVSGSHCVRGAPVGPADGQVGRGDRPQSVAASAAREGCAEVAGRPRDRPVAHGPDLLRESARHDRDRSIQRRRDVARRAVPGQGARQAGAVGPGRLLPAYGRSAGRPERDRPAAAGERPAEARRPRATAVLRHLQPHDGPVAQRGHRGRHRLPHRGRYPHPPVPGVERRRQHPRRGQHAGPAGRGHVFASELPAVHRDAVVPPRRHGAVGEHRRRSGLQEAGHRVAAVGGRGGPHAWRAAGAGHRPHAGHARCGRQPGARVCRGGAPRGRAGPAVR